MVVTLFGMITETSPEPQKATSPMVVTSSGMMVFMHPEIRVWVPVLMMALQLLGELYTVLFSSTMMEAKEGQREKGL